MTPTLAESRTKEQVYDADIFPLMKQIIDICHAHKIAMVASFAIPSEDDPALQCDTALLEDSHLEGLPKNVRDNFLASRQILHDGFLAFTRRLR